MRYSLPGGERRRRLPSGLQHQLQLRAWLMGRGVCFLEPKPHSQPRHIGDYLIAAVASSSFAEAFPSTQAPREKVTASLGRNSTTDKLWHNDYRPQTYVRGNRRRGRDDDLLYTSDGKHDIRAHLRLRRTMLTPCATAMGQKGAASARPSQRYAFYARGLRSVISHVGRGR